PGCIYYGHLGRNGKVLFVTDQQQSNRTACMAMRPPGTGEKDLEGARTPPESLDLILADLDNIRLPWRDLYRAYTEKPAEPAAQAAMAAGGEAHPVALSHGPNQLGRQKHSVDAGFNVHLTIDPATQHLVQQTSRCYAGDAASCRQLGMAEDRKFGEFTGLMYEKAAVRMAAVALIDVATGRIEALGSAHTDCYRQEYDGGGRRAAHCPDLPTAPRYEPDR